MASPYFIIFGVVLFTLATNGQLLSLSKYYDQDCCSPDLIFIIDVTDGVGFSRYNCESHIRLFLREFIARASQKDCDQVRAAVVEYGTKARIRFDFNKYNSTSALIAGIGRYSPGKSLGGYSNAKAGFAGADILLQNEERGRRPNSTAFILWIVRSTPVNKVALLDYVNSEIKPKARVVVIVVGNNTDRRAIGPVATSYFYHFKVGNIIDMVKKCTQFRINYCPATTTPRPTAKVTTTATTQLEPKSQYTKIIRTTTREIQQTTTWKTILFSSFFQEHGEPNLAVQRHTIPKTPTRPTTIEPETSTMTSRFPYFTLSSPFAQNRTTTSPIATTTSTTTTTEIRLTTTPTLIQRITEIRKPTTFSPLLSQELDEPNLQIIQRHNTTSRGVITRLTTTPQTTTTITTTVGYMSTTAQTVARAFQQRDSSTTTATSTVFTRPVTKTRETTAGTSSTTTPPMTVQAASQQHDPLPATELCYQCRDRRNNKDLYADATDCHYYYQCFYQNETFAVGIRQQCPVGTFWHDEILQCLPEGETPCFDRCMDDATSAKGCYAGTGCRQFFVCANTASYGMCCPYGSQFNEATCSCDMSSTCTDYCVQQGAHIATTVKPFSQYNATVCRDSWGTYISTISGQPNAYVLISRDGVATEKQYCPSGIIFDLVTCRCDIYDDDALFVPAKTPSRRAAILWLPFDGDTRDHSINKFSTFLYDGSVLDVSVSAFGSGSLYVNNGHVSIPGLKTYDMRNNGSWCAFFRCEAGNGFNCVSAGGILANNKDSSTNEECTLRLGNRASNNFIGQLRFWHPVGMQTVKSTISIPTNGWNHFCITYDGNAIRLYLNGVVADTEFVGGFIAVGHCAYAIGYDQLLGYFNGHIDDVLITPFAMTPDEINAHRTGDRNYLASRLFW